jgi:hypothetical protein
VPTRADFERENEVLIARSIQLGASRVQAVDYAKQFALNDRVTAWQRMMADGAGNIWAAEFRLVEDQPIRWMVFSPTGDLRGRIETPAGWYVLDIGSDVMVVGVEYEDGTSGVEVHRIGKP